MDSKGSEDASLKKLINNIFHCWIFTGICDLKFRYPWVWMDWWWDTKLLGRDVSGEGQTSGEGEGAKPLPPPPRSTSTYGGILCSTEWTLHDVQVHELTHVAILKLQIWYVSRHTYLVSENIPSSTKALLIFLMSAFCVQSQHFLQK